jgi:hypothetical protein
MNGVRDWDLAPSSSQPVIILTKLKIIRPKKIILSIPPFVLPPSVDQVA